MSIDFPKSGQVIEYHYLWRWQALNQETEGRKKRPCCIVIVVVKNDGKHAIFLAPITSKEPPTEREAIEIPVTEARRAKLEAAKRLWVILDELNFDVLEDSYTLEDRTPRGAFTPVFTAQIIRAVQSINQAKKLQTTRRN